MYVCDTHYQILHFFRLHIFPDFRPISVARMIMLKHVNVVCSRVCCTAYNPWKYFFDWASKYLSLYCSSSVLLVPTFEKLRSNSTERICSTIALLSPLLFRLYENKKFLISKFITTNPKFDSSPEEKIEIYELTMKCIKGHANFRTFRNQGHKIGSAKKQTLTFFHITSFNAIQICG